MSGRPDHAAARWADDGGPVTRDEGAADTAAEGGAADDGPILADVAALTAQRDEYLESLQRLKADFDNYRKRVARLQEEQSARAEANLVKTLLPVLDNLDLAWAHLGPRRGDEEPESQEARALGQARRQLLEVLGREGLERVDAVGVPFDPTVHDAVAHAEPATEPTEPSANAGDEPVAAEELGNGTANGSTPHTVTVDEVLRSGYRWRGQVLRPAMVRVRG
jgi:molecular chaperone GrpE